MSNMNVESSMAKLEEARQLASVQFRLERALKEADECLQTYQEDILIIVVLSDVTGEVTDFVGSS